MNIIIYRRRFSRWGVDGTLVIKGVKVCPTDVSRSPYLMPGNGPLTLKKGCIILGKAVATGLVIHSREHFDRLYERLKKGVKTYEGVSLSIIDLGTDEIPTEI